MTNKISHFLLALTVAGTLLLASSAVGQSSTPSPAQPVPAPAQPSGSNPAQPSPNPAQPVPSPAQPAAGQPLPGGGAGPGVYDPGHPGVNEINSRLQNQQRAIQEGVRNGTLTRQQAQQLWQHDRQVAQQERQDLANNGGHLTKQERQQLNKELNQNRNRISNEKKRGQ